MSDQNPTPQDSTELDIEELDSVAGGGVLAPAEDSNGSNCNGNCGC